MIEFLAPSANGSSFVINVKVDGDDKTSVTGFALNDAKNHAVSCEAIDCNRGFSLGSCHFCLSDGYAESGFYNCPETSFCIARESAAGAAAGFYACHSYHCLAHDNVGRGFWLTAGCNAVNCTADNNSTAGFDCTANDNCLVNCLSTNNGTYGYDADANEGNRMATCASYSNSSGRGQNYTADINPIVVTADPYRDDTNDDYRPNTDAAGGGLLLNVGFSPDSVTYPNDIGFARHAAAGGSNPMMRRMSQSL
jgi:hypothetical protein